MTRPEGGADPALVAMLNDLLMLDHDAVGAYTLAIAALRDDSLRQTLAGYRADHERHIQDLTAAIEARGGTPVRMPHIPTGVFKLAMQAMGIAGGDRAILLAFRTNEGQVRAKYARCAERTNPPDIAELLRRNAADEEKHYAWVVSVLDGMGAGSGTATGMLARAVETFHGATADVIEAAGRAGLEAMNRRPRR